MKSRPVRPPDPRSVDIAALCSANGTIDAKGDAAGLPRLAETLWHDADGTRPQPLSWSATGSLRPVRAGEPEQWLDLRVDASVLLTCQRCLQAVDWPLAIERRIRFVADEDEAARLDEDSEHDVLALAPRLDLASLIEDELILALPLVPRHEQCPVPLAAAAAGAAAAGGPVAEAEPTAHPFAALAALRDRRG